MRVDSVSFKMSRHQFHEILSLLENDEKKLKKTIAPVSNFKTFLIVQCDRSLILSKIFLKYRQKTWDALRF